MVWTPETPRWWLVVAAVAAGCGPRLPPGTPLAVRAAEPPGVVVVPADARAVGVTLHAGGSRWDPPDDVGAAWATWTTIGARDLVEVEVGRDATTLRAPCDAGDDCIARLLAALTRPPPSAAAPPARPAPSPHDLALAVVFEGHPYQHPPSGPQRGGAPPSDAARLRAWHRATARSTVDGFTTEAALAQPLAAALAALPATPPPDPGLFGPPRARQAEVFVVPSPDGEARAIVAGALPRGPLETTPLRRAPDAPDGAGAAACAAAALGRVGVLTAPAPLGDPLVHAAVVVASAPMPVDDAFAAASALLAAWPATLDALAAECPTHAATLRAAWPAHAPTLLVTLPAGVEDPWRRGVSPAADAVVRRPASSGEVP
jgi:hypothetical protein